MDKSEAIQHRYYVETAARYDEMHGRAREHEVALDYVLGLVRQLRASTILDVGSGTGRSVKFFLEKGLCVKGVEPVASLIEQATRRHGIPPGTIISGRGESLPFADRSFDAVCETGVLHHVARPNRIVKEMVRVARKAVFLSDENRFGHGPCLLRWFHVFLHKFRLFPAYNFLKTGGRYYVMDRDDGLRYSYSIYESLHPLAEWADRVFLIPTKGDKSTGWFQPLLTASHVLVCAVRERDASPL